MKRSALCTSRRELSNAWIVAKFGCDTEENEAWKVCTLSAYLPGLRFARQRRIEAVACKGCEGQAIHSAATKAPPPFRDELN